MRYMIADAHKNPDWIFIHVDKQLTRLKEERIVFGDEEGAYLLGNQEFYANIFAIPGIIEIALRRHDFLIRKSPVFQWDEIIPDALRVLRDLIAPGESLVKAEMTKPANGMDITQQKKPPR